MEIGNELFSDQINDRSWRWIMDIFSSCYGCLILHSATFYNHAKEAGSIGFVITSFPICVCRLGSTSLQMVVSSQLKNSHHIWMWRPPKTRSFSTFISCRLISFILLDLVLYLTKGANIYKKTACSLKWMYYWLLQDDDSYILPVLLRFDGQPEVDEEVCPMFAFHTITTLGMRYL